MSDLVATLTNESADDEGNAQCVYAFVGDRFLYCDAFGWLYYTGTHWRAENAEAALDRSIVRVLKERLNTVAGKDDVLTKVSIPTAKRVKDTKYLFRSMVTTNANAFDQSKDELNVANGVLNLRTGELSPHSAAQRFTYCLRVPYNPDADATFWTEFLLSVVEGGEPIVEYLQTVLGYAITGHTNEECLWYIFGPTRSGKGTFTETLLALLGAPLSIEVDFAVFTAKRDADSQNFDLAGLMPCRVVFTSESNRHETLNPGKIKQMTGGNLLRAAHKYRDPFEFAPMFKAMLVSNHPVNADVDDDAVWNRVKVLRFPTSRAGVEDKSLKAKMKTPEVLTGVLAWLVAGAQRWYASPRGLEHPRVIEANTQDHRQELDMVQAWLTESCVEKPELYCVSSKLHTSYATWCKENGVIPKGQRMFTLALKARGFEADVKFIEGRAQRIMKGLALLL